MSTATTAGAADDRERGNKGSPPDAHEKRSVARLWCGLLLPAASWAGDLVGRYMLIRYANLHRLRWPLAAITAVSLAALAWGAWLCWGAWREAHRAGTGPSPERAQRDHQQNRATLAIWGLALAAYFLLLILAQAYPTFALDPGEIT